MARKKLSFEDALGRLEDIADGIESGEVGLEESITRYEEGMKLLKHCREVLGRAEQRIVELQAEADDEDAPGDASGRAAASGSSDDDDDDDSADEGAAEDCEEPYTGV